MKEWKLWKNENNWGQQRAITDKPSKRRSFFFLSKPFHESIDNNSNTINTTPIGSLPSNTPVCPDYDTDTSLLSEGIDSLEQFFDTRLQNLQKLTQMSPGLNRLVREQLLTMSLNINWDNSRYNLHIKNELINKENAINDISIILKNITPDTYKVSPSNKESAMSRF